MTTTARRTAAAVALLAAVAAGCSAGRPASEPPTAPSVAATPAQVQPSGDRRRWLAERGQPPWLYSAETIRAHLAAVCQQAAATYRDGQRYDRLVRRYNADAAKTDGPMELDALGLPQRLDPAALARRAPDCHP